MNRSMIPLFGLLWLAAGASVQASDLFWHISPTGETAHVAASDDVQLAAYEPQRLALQQERQGVDPRRFDRAQEQAPARGDMRREAAPPREYIDGPPPGEVIPQGQQQPHHPGPGPNCHHHHQHCCPPPCCEMQCCDPCCPPCCEVPCCDMDCCQDSCGGDSMHCGNDRIDHSLGAKLKMAWWRVWHPTYWFRHPLADACHDHGHDCCDTDCCEMPCCPPMCCEMPCCDTHCCPPQPPCHHHGQQGGGVPYSSGYSAPQGAGGNAYAVNQQWQQWQNSMQNQQRGAYRRDLGRGSLAGAEEVPAHRFGGQESSDSRPMLIEARPMGHHSDGRGAGYNLPGDAI